MHICHLKLVNFGRFDELALEFPPVGVTTILGSNASGKTTVASAILAAILGPRSVRFHVGGRGPAVIQLDLAEGDRRESIRFSIAESDGEPRYERTYTDSGDHSLQLSQRLTDAVRSSASPRFLFGEFVGNSKISSEDLAKIRNAIPGKRLPSYLRNELELQSGPTRQIASAGMRSVIAILKELADRYERDPQIPLVIDEPFIHLHPSLRTNMLDLMTDLGHKMQIVLLMSDLSLRREHSAQIILPDAYRADMSVAGPGPVYNLLVPESQPARQFIVGKRIDHDEDKFLEFKEVRGDNPVSSITSVVDKYTVALLNSDVLKKGRILWGIRDDGLVVGVKLDRGQRDELRRVVTEKLHKITPTIAPTEYTIAFHSVSADTKDLYVIEVAVPASTETILYATGRQEVFVKTDAGKKKLSALEIQLEVSKRILRDEEPKKIQEPVEGSECPEDF